MNYADYNYYQTQYLSGKSPVLSADSFDYYARQASQLVDQYTFGRVSQTIIPDEVKLCTCELAELVFTSEKALHTGIRSESVAGASVSYATEEELKKAVANAQRSIVNRYLWKSSLLYTGGD